MPAYSDPPPGGPPVERSDKRSVQDSRKDVNQLFQGWLHVLNDVRNDTFGANCLKFGSDDATLQLGARASLKQSLAHPETG